MAPRLLWLYLRARHGRDGHSYCSVKGCERVKVMSTTSSKQICNCTAKAYPKYSRTPSAAVPMPALNAQPCKGCGAKQVGAAVRSKAPSHVYSPADRRSFCLQLVFSSEPWTSYLQTQIKSLCNKEQERGDNSSFIHVRISPTHPKPSSYQYDLPMSLRINFTCRFLSPGQWGDHPLLSFRIFCGHS